VLLLLTAIFVAIIYRWISLERLQRLTPMEALASPTPEPTVSTKPLAIGSGRFDTARLFNGITVHATVETPPGSDATTERADPQSYVLDLKLQARMPSPNQTIEELAKVTPELPRLLPGLAAMLSPDSVAPFFNDLYNTKIKMLRENLVRLDQLLSRHNFYDCQTVLRLRHPDTHRKAILLQADMDVDADGSDSDRLPAGSAASPNFKPFTSFRWAKKTNAPNPYLAPTEERLRKAELEYEQRSLSADRKKELRAGIGQLRDEITTLKKFSFLIGATDPYIVLPSGFARGADGGKVGDYAVVIFGDKIYPAVVGDIGPADKVGEASLRIAKQINTISTPMSRPVSDLKVTYLVFPGTADPPFGPPDLEKLQMKCETFVREIGGATVPLHHWENIIQPPPTPTPSPTPSPSPSPTSTPSPSPGASTTPSASPSATFAFPIPSPSAPATSPPRS
jgi:hypothetical protein